MSIIGSNILAGASGQAGYNLNNSLRFRSSASAYLSRTFTTPTDSKKFTLNMWVKLGYISPGGGSTGWKSLFGNSTLIGFGTSDLDNYPLVQAKATQLIFSDSTSSIAWTPLLRDPSAWYMMTLVYDSTQATAANRIVCYLNGTQLSVQNGSYPTLNLASQFNIASSINSFGRSANTTSFFDGYMAEINFVDGQALTPSSFGETDTTTGSWKPKAYTGTYGTNGFYLKFSDIATTSGSNAGLGKDFSGNANYWTTNNISVTSGTTYDAMLDVPTNTSATVANYAVINPLTNSSYSTLSSGNLQTYGNTATDSSNSRSSIAFTSGKYYMEFTVTGSSALGNTYPQYGIVAAVDGSSPNNGLPQVGATSGMLYPNNSVAYVSSGNKKTNNTVTSYGSSFTTGDVIGLAIDADNGAIYFSKNNTWQNSGVPTSGSSKTGAALSWTGASIELLIANSEYNGSGSHANFGQRPFSYTPPTGFVALNTYNLPTPTILQGNKYMDAVTYNGSNSNLTVTNAGSFQPDLVWAKSRSGAYNNILVDAIRGGNLYLSSNTTTADTTSTGLATFTSTGITWIGGASGVNASGDTYVDWMWKGGNGTSSNTSGSITSTVSVNATAGFSVVTYTGNNTNGATVGHGLGVAPAMIITKVRSTTSSWWVYQKAMGDNTMALNTTAAQIASTGNGVYNTASFTSNVFALGAGVINGSGATHVSYCWAEIAGFSKFTSYTGNGSTDGPFIFLGFRPKFVMIKRTDSTNDWNMYDSRIGAYNVIDELLKANTSAAETTYYTYGIDFLSNGFKLRETDTGQNASGGTYIVAAFAENPFKNSNAR